MLNFKHFKFRKEEYVILKKDTLDDALTTAVVLTSMLEKNTIMLARGYGDPNFDVSTVTVDDAVKHSAGLLVNVRKIVDRILENL